MTFQPVLPLTGYVGWKFLERTADQQQQVFRESAPIQRNTEVFRERIGGILTAEALVNDRQALAVALGAFGLDDDINNKAFIQKVLEDGTTDPEALSNRLSDTRYFDFSKAFGFGDLDPPRTVLSTFPSEIIERYESKQFERAVGEQNNDLRLALNLAPAMSDIISGSTSNDGRWFSMMGNAPLRSMFQTALGFPSSFATIDLDQQLDQFKSRAEATFGTSNMSEINGEENREKMIRLYLLRSEANAAASFSGASVALSLLQQV